MQSSRGWTCWNQLCVKIRLLYLKFGVMDAQQEILYDMDGILLIQEFLMSDQLNMDILQSFFSSLNVQTHLCFLRFKLLCLPPTPKVFISRE